MEQALEKLPPELLLELYQQIQKGVIDSFNKRQPSWLDVMNMIGTRVFPKLEELDQRAGYLYNLGEIDDPDRFIVGELKAAAGKALVNMSAPAHHMEVDPGNK